MSKALKFVEDGIHCARAAGNRKVEGTGEWGGWRFVARFVERFLQRAQDDRESARRWGGGGGLVGKGG